jgi:hypothetical protein
MPAMRLSGIVDSPGIHAVSAGCIVEQRHPPL